MMFQPIAMDCGGRIHESRWLRDEPSGLVEIYALEDPEHLPELAALTAAIATAQDLRSGELCLSMLAGLVREDPRTRLAGAFRASGLLIDCRPERVTRCIRAAVVAAATSRLPEVVWDRLSVQLALGMRDGDAVAACGTAATARVPLVNAVLIAPDGHGSYEVVVFTLTPELPEHDGVPIGQAYAVRVFAMRLDLQSAPA